MKPECRLDTAHPWLANDPGSSRRIQIATYNSAWPILFEQQATRIRDALKESALRIEHVGSTSVPGLAAKPVIDIHLTVQDSADENAYGSSLEKAGFRLIVREPDWFEHRMYVDLDPEVNLHVFSKGCPELARCRLFRDWLRIDQADRELYSQVKQTLALREWNHVNDYADAKRDIINEIMVRAEEWSRRMRRGCIT
ncbi:MAG: GrpB family protein [Pseudolabrys sp.]